MGKGFAVVASALLLVALGCASTPPRSCAPAACPPDAQLTADVRTQLSQYRELGPPNRVDVRTINGIVYLSGQVATDLQRQTAEAAARQASGVAQVVNTIALTYGGR